MSISRTGKLMQYINYRMRVTLIDGRQICGRFMAYDKHMNLVLGDSEEFRKLPPKKGKSEDEREERRVLGMLLLRGDEIISLTIEGPPPAEETRPVKQQVAPAGPGVGRAAGRGLPVGVPGQAPAVSIAAVTIPIHLLHSNSCSHSTSLPVSVIQHSIIEPSGEQQLSGKL
eukprot:GHUV01032937.1.p1 GENE.GHUV01032937.1~~GHUV01032937.1.p1  ORF type:complete len:171 (+),score=44.26 GHUV01032937.1:212-724(+)